MDSVYIGDDATNWDIYCGHYHSYFRTSCDKQFMCGSNDDNECLILVLKNPGTTSTISLILYILSLWFH